MGNCSSNSSIRGNGLRQHVSLADGRLLFAASAGTGEAGDIATKCSAGMDAAGPGMLSRAAAQLEGCREESRSLQVIWLGLCVASNVI